MEKEKVVGILGGMGPFATVEFYRQILSCTPANKDWEHLRILIDSNTKIPSRTRAILYDEDSPAPMMVESINMLSRAGADFVAVPCNSAHYFYDDVTPFIEIPWLNMIDITSKKVLKSWKRPLILGGYVTVEKRLYSKYIPEAVYPSEPWDTFIIDVIEEIKLTSKLSLPKKQQFRQLIDRYRNEIDSVILACTEISLINRYKSMYGLQVVDSGLEYADEVVRYAKRLSET